MSGPLQRRDTETALWSHEARLTAIERYPPCGQWHDAVLVAPVANVGDPYHPLQYQRCVAGKVNLRGAITSLGAVGSTITTLPLGYRPSKANRFLLPTDSPTVFAVVEAMPVVDATAPSLVVFRGFSA